MIKKMLVVEPVTDRNHESISHWYVFIFLFCCTSVKLSHTTKEHRLRVFEVLIRVSGPKREEVAGGWRRLDEELHNLYDSPNMRVSKSRMIKSWNMQHARGR
jgi:hypothetical protein